VLGEQDDKTTLQRNWRKGNVARLETLFKLTRRKQVCQKRRYPTPLALQDGATHQTLTWPRFFLKNSRQTDIRQLQERQGKSKSEGLLKRRAAADLSLAESD
jgi:hypothetical protein